MTTKPDDEYVFIIFNPRSKQSKTVYDQRKKIIIIIIIDFPRRHYWICSEMNEKQSMKIRNRV